ncbi:RdgB/HAM1 family non-canonical purine NTP pyrophosphatase [Mageeibacillus indolicus]|nr:RdgB/HAM1 family non-canonical purine NTP pyrophosphatase [Mageeibacillus indolicus]
MNQNMNQNVNRLIIATHNRNKLREFTKILGDKFQVISLSELNLNEEIPETGTTFTENCLIKLHTLAKLYPNDYILADDSGLCIDALNGAPGVYSARFCGETTSYDVKIKQLQSLLREVPEEARTAHFVCVLALHYPDGQEKIMEGRCDGLIAHKTAGSNGFGYDPIFYLPHYGCTMAELSETEKNKISHRGAATAKLLAELKL